MRERERIIRSFGKYIFWKNTGHLVCFLFMLRDRYNQYKIICFFFSTFFFKNKLLDFYHLTELRLRLFFYLLAQCMKII